MSLCTKNKKLKCHILRNKIPTASFGLILNARNAKTLEHSPNITISLDEHMHIKRSSLVKVEGKLFKFNCYQNKSFEGEFNV